MGRNLCFVDMDVLIATPNTTNVGRGSYGICRLIDTFYSRSPDQNVDIATSSQPDEIATKLHSF